MAADIIRALVWPALVALGLVLFRHQIARALQAIGSNAESVKVGAAGLSFEVQMSKRVQDEGVETVRFARVPGGPVRSGEKTLYDYFNASATPADYVVVDLGDGAQWLSSRLYLLAVIARRQRGVTRMVFVRDAVYPEVFFGQATVEAVASAVAGAEPDLEAAMAWALYSAHRLGGGPQVVGTVAYDPTHPQSPPEVNFPARLPTLPPRNYPLGPGGRFMSDDPLLLLVNNYLAILRQTPAPPTIGSATMRPGSVGGAAVGAPQASGQPIAQVAATVVSQAVPAVVPDPVPTGWVQTPSGITERATWVKPAALARILGKDLDTSRLCWNGRGTPPTPGATAGWMALVDQDNRFQDLAELRSRTA